MRIGGFVGKANLIKRGPLKPSTLKQRPGETKPGGILGERKLGVFKAPKPKGEKKTSRGKWGEKTLGEKRGKNWGRGGGPSKKRDSLLEKKKKFWGGPNKKGRRGSFYAGGGVFFSSEEVGGAQQKEARAAEEEDNSLWGL